MVDFDLYTLAQLVAVQAEMHPLSECACYVLLKF